MPCSGGGAVEGGGAAGFALGGCGLEESFHIGGYAVAVSLNVTVFFRAGQKKAAAFEAIV